jgi:hypothetical protein
VVLNAEFVFSVGPSVGHHAAEPGVRADPRKRAGARLLGRLNYSFGGIASACSTHATLSLVRRRRRARVSVSPSGI